jgi:hypothetical protein
LDLTPDLAFNQCLEDLEFSKGFTFALQKINPTFARKIVYEYKKEFVQ